MAVLTADHYIPNPEPFRQALETAFIVAGDGNLVTLGIKPTSASTGFGYIQQGKRIGLVKGFRFFVWSDLPKSQVWIWPARC